MLPHPFEHKFVRASPTTKTQPCKSRNFDNKAVSISYSINSAYESILKSKTSPSDLKMPRFLGLASYLTTNRSNISKQDATKLRRSCLSKNEVLRENVADRLKCPLCFCIPCFVVAAVMLVFIGVYVTNPYMKGLYGHSS